MLLRILLTLAVIAFAVWWLQRKIGGAAKPAASTARDPRHANERVLPCAHCGVHIPESEGILEKGRFFCCREHQLSDPANGEH